MEDGLGRREGEEEEGLESFKGSFKLEEVGRGGRLSEWIKDSEGLDGDEENFKWFKGRLEDLKLTLPSFKWVEERREG